MTYRDTAYDDEELRHRLEPHWFEGSFSAMGDGGDPLPDELLSFYAKRYDCDLSPYPVLMGIFAECMQLDAFDSAQPSKQPE